MGGKRIDGLGSLFGLGFTSRGRHVVEGSLPRGIKRTPNRRWMEGGGEACGGASCEEAWHARP